MNQHNSVKSIKEVQNSYKYKLFLEELEAAEVKPKRTFISTFSGFLFYFTICAIVMLVFIYSQRTGKRNLFGYSYYNILTTSMQSELPQGSLIIVHKETDTLKVGDDITFFESENKIVTHRIIEILDNYEDSGQIGYKTQGIENPNPDNYITYEGNVIGKVVWHVPYLGFVMAFIAKNVLLFAGLFIGLLLLSMLLRRILITGYKHSR